MLSKDLSTALSPASFWVPDYFGQSAWTEHAPFAFWLIDALRPTSLVELGTHYGYSYLAFCQAIERISSNTSAYAVDTWAGDEHAGFYDASVYDTVLSENRRYAAFSRMIRATFEDASTYFGEHTIDLLHIDGRHYYDDVKEDFEIWLPKLTENAIVLFHDTNVRERGFGVWKFFSELGSRYRTFNFFHGNGLGVLAIGKVPDALESLFSASKDGCKQIRNTYAALGGLLVAKRQLVAKGEAIDALLVDGAVLGVDSAESLARLADWDSQIQRVRARLEHLHVLAAAADPQPLIKATADVAKATSEVRELSANVSELKAKLDDSQDRLASLQAQYDRELLSATQLLAHQSGAIEALKIEALEKERQEEKRHQREPYSFNKIRPLLAEMIIEERRTLQQVLSEKSALETASAHAVVVPHDDGAVASLAAELSAMRGSTSWRLTAPIRSILRRTPKLRAPARKTAQAIYWTLSGQLPTRWALWRRVRAKPSAYSTADTVIVRDPPVSALVIETAPHPVLREASRRIDEDFSIAVPFVFEVTGMRSGTPVAAIVHLFYEDLAVEMYAYLSNVPGNLDVFISTTDSGKATVIRTIFANWPKGRVTVRVVENRGRDIAPKLVAFADVYEKYTYVLHLHGKRSKHADLLASWRHYLLESLTGSPEIVSSVIHVFESFPSIGMICAQHFEPMRHWTNWGGNFEKSEQLAQCMGFTIREFDPLDFPSGSMFWARSSALKPLLDLKLDLDQFDAEGNQTDATLAHCIERTYFHVCEAAGFDWIKIAVPELLENTPGICGAPKPADVASFIDRFRFRLLTPNDTKPRVTMPQPVAVSPLLLERIRARNLGVSKSIDQSTRVAIGLVTFNNSLRDLNRAVAAAKLSLSTAGLGQEHAFYLVDNGASTEDFLTDPDFLVRLSSRGNVGFGGGHNYLMEAAFSAGFDVYIAINPDGFLHPDAVGAMVRTLNASHGKALVEALQFPSEHPKRYAPDTLDTPWVSGACLAIPKLVHEAIGGFDEIFFMYCEDVDYSWRARAAGFALKMCPTALFLHRVTNREVPRSTLQMIFTSGVILARKWGDPEFEQWLKTELKARNMPLPSISPMPVPEESRQFADFKHEFTFSQARW